MGCAVWAFSLVAVSRDLSLVAAHRLRFAVASLVAEDGLQGSEPPGSRAQAPRMWPTGLAALRHVGLPGSGIRPVSPASAGGFFATEPPGKPRLPRVIKYR